jgi:hypothetical protein
MLTKDQIETKQISGILQYREKLNDSLLTIF